MKRVLNWVEGILVSPVLLYRYIRFGKIYRRIYLGEGKLTILNSADYYRLKKFKWHVFACKGKFYAERFALIKNTWTKRIFMHRQIMNAPKGKLVDHRNGDSLDNRRSNLRLATHSQNMMNRRKTKKKTSSKYLGLSRDKIAGEWKVQLCHYGKNIWVGRFKNEIDAAKAYDKAAKKYFGQFARLNFPDPPDKWQGLDYHISKLLSRLRPWIACAIHKRGQIHPVR